MKKSIVFIAWMILVGCAHKPKKIPRNWHVFETEEAYNDYQYRRQQSNPYRR